MSTTEYISDRLAVTRYAGPGDTPGPHRVRLRIDGPNGSIYGLTMREALAIGRALSNLTYDSLQRWALGDDHAGTNTSANQGD